MKKTLALVLALTLAFALCVPAFAATPPDTDTEITTIIAETYQIIIPADKTIEFEAASTALGNIGLSAARLGPDRQVVFTADVAADGAGTMALAGDTATLAYTLKFDAVPGNEVSFTEAATAVVYVAITAEAWDAAPAGAYSDTITFTVGVEDIVD